jgi:hypothetical protein
MEKQHWKTVLGAAREQSRSAPRHATAPYSIALCGAPLTRLMLLDAPPLYLHSLRASLLSYRMLPLLEQRA